MYLELHDNPPGAANGEAEEATLAAMSPEERKKYKLAKKKEVRVGGLVGQQPWRGFGPILY